MEQVSSIAGSSVPQEVFALTDEQILEMEPQAEVASDEWRVTSALKEAQLWEQDGAERKEAVESGEGRGPGARDGLQEGVQKTQTGVAVAQEPPRWMAERMRDPWHGDEAKELWEGTVQARQEAAAYREAIATPEEARALKEIYPGGVNEAKTAAERARQLEEFDAAYFGTAGRPAEELGAARMQLAQRLMEQDPGAFREMVAAGVRLLEGKGKGVASKESGDGRPATGNQEERSGKSLTSNGDRAVDVVGKGLTPEGVSYRDGRERSANATAAQEVAAAYVNFEKAANAELEKSVGGAIARAMESSLPNLKSVDGAGREGAGQGTSLRERLGTAVREEVEAALKSDAQLGEQVARILGARRFDDATRAQVVRVIDARAQQLVPGAVKRVVGSWTTATLGTRGKSRAAEAGVAARSEMTSNVAPRTEKSGQNAGKDKKTEGRATERAGNRGRVDYGKLSDEQILEL